MGEEICVVTGDTDDMWTRVVTGDTDDMWTRNSAVQVEIYVGRVARSLHSAGTL
jgi:meiotically up-regulated gene 157 (Mug157) protein